MPPVVEVVVQCGQRNESAGGDGLAVGLIPPVGDASLGGSGGIQPVGDSRVVVGNHGPKNAVVGDHGLVAVQAGLAVPPVQGLVPDVTQLDLPVGAVGNLYLCLLYTSPSPRDKRQSRMPSSA